MTMFQPAIGAHDLEGLVAKYQKQLTLEALAYLESRDVHEKTISNFALGYEDNKIGFSVEQATLHLAGRIIFPIRDIDGRILDVIGRLLDDREPKYKSLLGAGPLLFNAPVLQENEEVVLAGGMFDVLSLSQMPLPAVAVPDCYSFHKEQAELFAGKRVYVCYGNDDEGRRENERVANLLEAVVEDVYIVTLPEGIKDINDLFVRAENATEVFVSLINRAIQTKQESGIAPDSHYLTMYNEEYLKRHRGQTTGIPSGISELDDYLMGGFRPGLYVVQGASGVDKTTLVRQMADHAAFLDCPVAFFTWEASSFELWANSISRLLDCSIRDILHGNVEPEKIKQTNERYQEYAAHMWTVESNVDTSAEEIGEYIQRIAQTIGKMPIVFLDSLQRISYSGEATMLPTPERAARVLYELQQISRELSCPLIVTANEERDPGSLVAQAMDATSDVILCMQSLEEVEPGRSLLLLEVEKNRNGETGTIEVTFDQLITLFKTSADSTRKAEENGADLTSA
ncbi:MAG: DnaB-like helicase C-terminal domain-containing protein [Tumebacillaceae bacterium]